MTERLQEILNRKPSKWGNLTVKEFERDIKLLQERVQELEETNKKNYWIAADFKFENLKLEQQNKRYKQALEFYADKKTYERAESGELTFVYRPIEVDRGEKARNALEGDEE